MPAAPRPQDPLPEGQTIEDSPAVYGHCAFFSQDGKTIWPLDTYRGFRALGYNWLISVYGMFIIHLAFSLVTSVKHFGFIPDPLFRLEIRKQHKAKHGSDTESYDKKGRFDQRRFDELFLTYTRAPHDSMSFWEMCTMVRGQTDALDPFGWSAATLEWLATWLLLWPEDGRMKKEEIKGVYDGSIFYQIADKRRAEELAGKRPKTGVQGQEGIQNGKANGTRQRKQVAQ